jgi:quercetin 2,3-dioxygenase
MKYNLMKINIVRSEERKVSEFSDVLIKHSFNYGQFFNPLREKFGVLRVLNDEWLSPGYCFNERFHKHIEVLILPLSGIITCNDKEGRSGSADSEGALLISTGSGLSYTVCNSSSQNSAEAIEIWIFAHKNDRPTGITEAKAVSDLRLNQNAFIWRLEFGEKESVNYKLKLPGNILLLFVIKGEVTVEKDVTVGKDATVGKNVIKAFERDSVEITEVDSDVEIKAVKGSELIIIEVPVN